MPVPISHLRRRDLLAAFAATPALAAQPRYQPVFAGQAYVWSQHLGRRGQKIEQHFDEVLGSFQRAGYSTLELVGASFFAPEFAERTAGLLRKYKLKVPVVYQGGEMHTEAGAEKTIAAALDLVRRVRKATGLLEALSFNANPLPQRARKSDEQLKIQAAAINRLAAELKRENAYVMLHQHAPEMAENAREWRHVLANTDPGTVKICLDTHWVLRGGEDVMTHVREATSRLASLHLRNSRNGIWIEEFADGDIDYREIAAHLRAHQYRGYLVVELAYDKETEITAPLESSLRRSLDYARRVFA